MNIIPSEGKVSGPWPQRLAAAMENRPYRLLAALGVLLLLVSMPGLMRPFWYDEIYTFQMSQLPSHGVLWQALKDGLDQNPPPFYWLTQASQRAFGANELGTRMPEFFGFALLSVCLFGFVARRCGAAFGFVAALLPWLSSSNYLATEARPYGLMLGFVSLAALGWQTSIASQRRGLALAGMWLGLVGALMSHCYAVVALGPFVIAEAVRFRQSRKLDWALWGTFAAAMPVIAVYLPLVGGIKIFVFGSYFFRVPWSMVPAAYEAILDGVLYPLLMAALFWVWSAGRSGPPPASSEEGKVPTHEWALAMGFALAPMMAVVLAKVLHSQFFPRYGVAGLIGLSLLVPLALFRRSTNPANPAIVAAGLMSALLMSLGGTVQVALFAEPKVSESASLASRERRQEIFDIRPDLPLVVASGIRYMEINQYAPQAVADRAYYLLDPKTALEYTQTNLFEKVFPMADREFKLRAKLASYQEFTRAHDRFLVYGPYGFANDWLIKKLIDDGADLKLINVTPNRQHGDCLLLEAVMPRPSVSSVTR